MSKVVQPTISEKAFNCPHCLTFTTQYWYTLGASEVVGERKIPLLADETTKMLIMEAPDIPEDERFKIIASLDKLISGQIIIDWNSPQYNTKRVENLHISRCYNCENVSVWVYTRLIFPVIKAGVQPNSDLPHEVVRDFEEAREIVYASPRGAAALLRLCVQKLCQYLGEKGKNIDEDIANLVKKGLQPLVQKSLDIVRVIGNEAVHPGVIDLKDDRDTALRLFELINSIADQMITHPKGVAEMYSKLPEAKRKAIEDRDKK